MFEVKVWFKKRDSKNYKRFLHFCDSYEEVLDYMNKVMSGLAPKYSVFKFKVSEAKNGCDC